MSSARLPVLQAVPLRVKVAEAIRQALLEGRFQPGEDLPEAALAREMNVSRGPVRKALLVLAHEGLITQSQNHGFAVLGLPGHMRDFIRACKGPDPACANFDVSAPFVEWMLFGVIALRHEGKLEYDPDRMRITNNSEANKLLKPTFRKGWEFHTVKS